MATDETVKLHIIIDIQVDDIADTGITVADWNAKTDAARAAIVRELWENYAQHDNGGIRTVTDGAEGV